MGLLVKKIRGLTASAELGCVIFVPPNGTQSQSQEGSPT